ncbi:MAG: PASTA domain-containing protein [Clostridia bacterium]|nr:PASTA domain-containing protein [Clostridia bacterium]
MKNEITVPEITGLTVQEAEKILKECKLEMYINNETEGLDKQNTVVTQQTPKAGITVYEGSFVYVDV